MQKWSQVAQHIPDPGLQDPEGLLRAPQSGHISRRILQKEVEQNKEMQEELDKLKREKGEELERQREVSACHSYIA